MCARDSRAALCQQLQNSCRLVTKGPFPPCPLTKEALCLRMLLLHFGFGDPEPTAIYCDNKGAITMGLHPTNKAAMRHVDMCEHFCQQHVEAGNVTVPPPFAQPISPMTWWPTRRQRLLLNLKPTRTRHTSRMFGDQSIAPPVLPIQSLVAT
jgi:hypothetical protein